MPTGLGAPTSIDIGLGPFGGVSLALIDDDENLDITPDHILVLRNAGPQGGPGMPEWGMLPMPKALGEGIAMRTPHQQDAWSVRDEC